VGRLKISKWHVESAKCSPERDGPDGSNFRRLRKGKKNRGGLKTKSRAGATETTDQRKINEKKVVHRSVSEKHAT